MFSADLQTAIYQHLLNDISITNLLGQAIYDAPIRELAGVGDEYVTIGEEVVRPFMTKTSTGAYHDFDVTIHTDREGFTRAKRIASSICESLLASRLELDGGQIVDLRFLRAKAQRGPSPARREIALRFRAVIDGV